MGVGLYLHIPFCVKKCAYCDFPSYAGRGEVKEAVLKKMQEEMKRAQGLKISTVYMGGGTPTSLETADLQKLFACVFDCFDVDRDAEITVEANPGTVDLEKLQALRSSGVNRLSFGAQAMQTSLLETLGRIHTWEDVENAVGDARKAGFSNINLDLMYGLPGQTPRQWRETLESALKLSPQHISLYSLIVEEQTPFHARYARHPELLPGEDALEEMTDDALWMTQDAGLERYEISNYAREGFESRHNMDCWLRKNYLGIGCAAHSFMNEQRWHNDHTLEGYLAGKRSEILEISPKEARFERLMLGLRLVDGIEWGEQALFDQYEKQFKRLRESGLMDWDDEHLWLTRRGLDLQNQVLVSLMED